MADQADYENARKALEYALQQTKIYGEEVSVAVYNANLVKSKEARQLFVDQAKRAMIASENWRKSTELALNTLAQIEKQ